MAKDFFTTATPEEVGIDSQTLTNFLKKLEEMELPLHSAILIRHGKLVMETYYKPYSRDTLHRMFSVTKSFVSLAIGILAADGKISLDDKIIKYFPEKLPETIPAYLEMLTIRDMLKMSTCYSKTTYKVLDMKDWTKTFFTATPEHVPGTQFSYDTSSTHTLAALVEKLTGMELLDFLRKKLLDELDFSKQAYCVKDPVGVSMGGSGMMATPYDIIKVMYVISQGGKYNGKQLLPKDYLDLATSKQIDTYAKMSVIDEMQGYGYQFWRVSNNGFAMYGMGGQLFYYFPETDILFATTADAQGRQGGVELIHQTFWDEIYQKVTTDKPLPANNAAYEELKNYCSTRELFHINGNSNSPIESTISGATYILDENSMGFNSISLHLNMQTDKNLKCGELYYSNETGNHSIQFGINENVIQQFPHYDFKSAISGTWRDDNTFLIKVNIIDEAVGNLYIQLTFKEEYVTVFFRKVEETFFNEFNGTVSGKRQ